MIKRNSILILIFSGVCLATAFYFIFNTTTLSQPVQFVISEGESLKSLTTRLEDEGLVTSSILLRAYLSFTNNDTRVQLGEYEFDGTVSLFSLAREIVENGPKNPLISVTIPEGSTSLEVFQSLVKALPSLNKNTFTAIIDANNIEGKLFPSTYHLLPSYNEESIIGIMMNTYRKKVGTVLSGTTFPKPLISEDEVITLASILEGEANTEKDMKIVAGILLERMRIGMPLQVDVAMETYKRRGLPEKPINNPGLVAIRAVLDPVYTDYLYYITGNDGEMYYAKTYNDHKRNIQKHLR